MHVDPKIGTNVWQQSFLSMEMLLANVHKTSAEEMTWTSPSDHNMIDKQLQLYIHWSWVRFCTK